MSLDNAAREMVEFPQGLPPSFDRLTVEVGSLLGLVNNAGPSRFPDFEVTQRPGEAHFLLRNPQLNAHYDELAVRRDGVDLCVTSTRQSPLYEERDGDNGVRRHHFVYNLQAGNPTVDEYEVTGIPAYSGLRWHEAPDTSDNSDGLWGQRISDTKPTRGLNEEDCLIVLGNIGTLAGERPAAPAPRRRGLLAVVGGLASRLVRPVGMAD